jgi:hypothetical protein
MCRYEQQQRANGIIGCNTLKQSDAVVVDAIVNTIGFPLVGGPAGMFQSKTNIVIRDTMGLYDTLYIHLWTRLQLCLIM